MRFELADYERSDVYGRFFSRARLGNCPGHCTM